MRSFRIKITFSCQGHLDHHLSSYRIVPSRDFFWVSTVLKIHQKDFWWSSLPYYHTQADSDQLKLWYTLNITFAFDSHFPFHSSRTSQKNLLYELDNHVSSTHVTRRGHLLPHLRCYTAMTISYNLHNLFALMRNWWFDSLHPIPTQLFS